jgi:hypothetical protein
MGVLSLVLGILGLVLFDWLGASIGGGMVAASAMQSALAGNVEVSTGPIWALGLLVGVLIPLVAVVTGALAIKSGKKKGLGIAGLICGAIAAVIGIILTVGAAKAVDMTAQLGAAAMNDASGAMGGDQAAMQEALKKGLEEAMKQQQ